MAKRGRHTEGFTLAELLMSVAIILILAAIAFPSIVSAQNNMRMLELNNAAQAIANAAQAQMTAKKVSGTWVDSVKDGDSYRVCFPAARSADVSRETSEGSSRSQGETEHVSRETLGSDEVAPPSASAAESSKRYMTADTAREQGIVPALAVEEAVRDADYIIEFDADTAQVIGVFYADGRSGFFGSTPASTNAAKTYYETEGASTDQAARMGHDPMIGYYGGTPAGATPEKALANPVIWVDEATGCLMVQDPNIAADGSAGSTTSTVTIENTSKNVAFAISGLSNGTTMVSLSTADDGSDPVGFTNFAAAIKQQTRDDANVKGNVWAIDLNALSQLVTRENDGKPTTGGSQEAALKQVFDACVAGDALTVSVETKDTSRSCVPGTAAAHVEWPNPAGKLTMLITNPYSAVVAGEKNEAYTDPQVRSTVADSAHPSIGAGSGNGDGVVKDGLTVTPFYEDKDNHFRVSNANTQLKQENPQAGYQSYAGGWIASSSVRDDATYRLEGTVGAYNNHAYQIWELWIKRADTGECMRVGYLNDGKWEWGVFNQKGVNYDYRFLNDCFTWYGTNETGDASGTLAGTDTDANNVISLRLDVQKFYAEAENHKNHGLADEDGNATVYVRTAPKASEVQAYFNKLAVPEPASVENPLKAAYLSGSARETGSRTADTPSVTARAAFEGEFGASSSDVSWAVSKTTVAGFSQGDEYLSTAGTVPVRVYYSIAPGVGFANIRSYDNGNGSGYLSGVLSTRLTNVSLWLYRGPSFDDLAVMPPALLKNYKGLEFSCRQGSTYDFKITTQEDYRFYRALLYYTEQGVGKPDYAVQYVPYSSIESEVVLGEVDPPAKPETDEFTYRFVGWETVDVRDAGSGSLVCVPGDTVGKYDGQLAFMGTTFVAKFDEIRKPKVSLGLAYIELDANGAATSWYGYYGTDEGSFVNELRTDNAIDDWGYFILVGEGTEKSAITQGKGSQYKIKDEEAITVSLSGTTYSAYRIVASGDVALKNQSTPVEVFVNKSQPNELTATYQVNFNFARAVTLDGDAAKTWGEDASPWSVRHAMQFPGSLKWFNNVNGVQYAYMGDAFIQEHDLDMKNIVDGYKFNNIFTGAYDGGSYRIFNFGRATYASLGDTSGFSVLNSAKEYEGVGQGQGLFPWVLSDGTSSAVIKNVRLVVDGNSYAAVGTNSNSNFGFLVGNAAKSKIVNCTLEGASENATAVVDRLSYGTHAVSPLIGYAEECDIEKCKVFDVDVRVSWRDTGTVDGLSAGLIVARTSQVNLSSCSVTDVVFNIENKVKPSSVVCLGGVVGSAGWSLNESYCTVKTVSFSFPENQQVLTRLSAGSVIGGQSGACSAHYNTVTQPVQYSLGGSAWVPIEAEVGGSL